jgi:uncharacterized protein (TIGR02466 family)
MSKKNKQEQKPEFESYYYFPSAVYSAAKPEFLEAVNEVAAEALKAINREVHEIYPMSNTDNFASDPRIADFVQYIGQNGWSILQGQGYAMENIEILVESVWAQEHRKHSLMEQHIHGNGAQLVGFYFLDTPDDCSRAMFHDPRAGKVQINMPEHNMGNATPASDMINFAPEPGMLLISNAWLPHSFGRHGSNKPLRFVHFNLGVRYVQSAGNINAAEVI